MLNRLKSNLTILVTFLFDLLPCLSPIFSKFQIPFIHNTIGLFFILINFSKALMNLIFIYFFVISICVFQTLNRHSMAFSEHDCDNVIVMNPGMYHWRDGGEKHMNDPLSVGNLQVRFPYVIHLYLIMNTTCSLHLVNYPLSFDEKCGH